MTTHKTDNSDASAKLDLRRLLLRELKPPLRVLDCFAGDRALWTALRLEFSLSSYLALDVERKGGATLKVDSARWLAKAPVPFNVFDLDAYGDPWRQYEALVKRADVPGPVVVFLTVGYIISPGLGVMSGVSKAGLRLAGIPEAWADRVPKETGHLRRIIIELAMISARRHGWAIERSVEMETRKKTTRYVGLRLARHK